MDTLALDLGRTTGFALFHDDDLSKVGEFVDPDEGYLMIRTLTQPDQVVVEKPIVIRGELGNEMAGLIARTEAEYGDKITYVTPSQWKPHPLTKKILHNMRRKNLTKHEKDAICIAGWFLFVHLQGKA